MDLQSGKFGFTHPLESSLISQSSAIAVNNQVWYHLHNQVDQGTGDAQLFVNGSEVVQLHLTRGNPCETILSPNGSSDQARSQAQ